MGKFLRRLAQQVLEVSRSRAPLDTGPDSSAFSDIFHISYKKMSSVSFINNARFCLDTGEKLLFFTLEEKQECSQSRVNIQQACADGVSETFIAGFSENVTGVKSPVFSYQYHELQREVKRLPDVSNTWTVYKIQQNAEQTSCKKGLLLGLVGNLTHDGREQVLSSLGKHGFHPVFEASKSSVTGDVCKMVRMVQDGSAVKVVPTEILPPPALHPAFLDETSNHVFHSFHEALSALRQCPMDRPGTQELLQRIQSKEKEIEASNKQPTKFPFIVIEGLDATGKSTLVAGLKARLSASQLGTPPDDILDLRPTFDDQSPLIRRLFYSLGNYLVAGKIIEATKSQLVIMDRFWHSTAAYTIATDCGSGGVEALPGKGHPVYSWPRDLIKPSLVIFLTVSADVRRQRLMARFDTTGLQVTPEELALDQSIKFRESILQAYRNMCGVPVHEISADGSREDVQELAMKAINSIVNA